MIENSIVVVIFQYEAFKDLTDNTSKPNHFHL